jgi:hypothetical protein
LFTPTGGLEASDTHIPPASAQYKPNNLHTITKAANQRLHLFDKDLILRQISKDCGSFVIGGE